ncbi:MAG TPA: (d)CMP kinase [Candidatus Angelobacter sp.]|jgi:cytidylate kinase
MAERISGARKIVIAIDGPAGSGKSTLASLLARKYNYTNIETGAMYRALAFKAVAQNIPLDDEAKLAALARQSQIDLVPRPEGNRVLLDGVDVTESLRNQEVTEAASKVSVHPMVREWMVASQRAMGAGGGIVMEGRDIGTKVFPDAEVKIFLDAAPEIRGTRRFMENPAATAQEASVVAELQARDQRDRTRANSPLAPAADAVLIDSTYLTLDQVLARAMELIDARLEKKISRA